MTKYMFLHGYESSGNAFKASFLRRKYPYMLTPTFSGDLSARMTQLQPLLQNSASWVLIGSSFGGLMATLAAQTSPEKIQRLVLMAPALIPPFLPSETKLTRIEIPTLIIHGQQDSTIPLASVLPIAQDLFHPLEFRLVDDDHRLHTTVQNLDWDLIILPQ